MKVLIGGAWPYANGSLHIGHIAALLPGDILARYHRMRGDDVYYVSGSDCHGTPISLKAERDGTTAEEVSERYHREFADCFAALGFSYDCYTKTSGPEHIAFVQAFHRRLYESGYVYEKMVEQTWCPHCNRFLPDRFVTGHCPACGSTARGDQCEACGTMLEPESLRDTACSVCGGEVQFRPSRHLFLALSQLERKLAAMARAAQGWRRNAVGLTGRYIVEGLRDRTITRDLDWGIPVPREGYEDKKIYIWAENVLGYLSASEIACRERRESWEELWGENALHYYVHGKDNIPFHTVILPALLTAHGGLHLPDRIVSSEHLTLEGRKISTSANWAIWVKDMLNRYPADSIRYFLTTNAPEKRDADFSWAEFVACHNSELLGAFGNLVNRTLQFVARYLGGAAPQAPVDPAVRAQVEACYEETAARITALEFKAALDGVFSLIRRMNKYFDTRAPWFTRKDDPADCKAAIATCLNAIANLGNLLEPFLPHSAQRIRWMLGLGEPVWQVVEVPAGLVLGETAVLFPRLDPDTVAREQSLLGGSTQS